MDTPKRSLNRKNGEPDERLSLRRERPAQRVYRRAEAVRRRRRQRGDRIPAINQLHHLIARVIVLGKAGMQGNGLRFLRTEIGQAQVELASILHVDPQTIGCWESGEIPIDGRAETVFRRLVVEKLLIPFEEKMERHFRDELRKEPSSESARSIPLERLTPSCAPAVKSRTIEIKVEDGGYRLIAA